MRQDRRFILGVLSTGHGISHWFDQGFLVLLPTITTALGMSTLQVGSLATIRQVGFGAVNLPGGLVVDMMKGQWGLILTGCLIWAALAYALVGASYTFPVLVIAVIMISLPGALWHLPSTAALSQRFPDWRGFAISIHGFGANVGNILGPIVAGGLLEIIEWRWILYISVVPALVMALVVWLTLRNIGRDGEEDERRQFKSQLLAAAALLRNRTILGLATVALLRDMALSTLFIWTPFYLRDEIGMGAFNMGVHMALLTGMGVASTPVLGWLSDKFNRKLVLAPGLAISVALSVLIVNVGGGLGLTFALATMGLFTFALHQIIQASVLDNVSRGPKPRPSDFCLGPAALSGLSPTWSLWS